MLENQSKCTQVKILILYRVIRVTQILISKKNRITSISNDVGIRIVKLSENKVFL